MRLTLPVSGSAMLLPVGLLLLVSGGSVRAQDFHLHAASIAADHGPYGPMVPPAAAAAAQPQPRMPTPQGGAGPGLLAQPDSLPTSAPAAVSVAAAGDYRAFMGAQVTTIPTGNPASLYTPEEPSVAFNHDTGLMVANQFAALSKDSGKTWTTFDPTVMFPPRAGGGGAFGGDQRVLYIPQQDVMVWYVQYRFSATLDNGNFKLIYFVGRNALRTLTPSGSYDVTPENLGFAAGRWLDFPDLAFSDGFLYGSTNVFLGAGGAAGESVWRAALPQLVNGTFAYVSFFHTGAGGLYNMRFTQGAGNTMRWASNSRNNTTLSLFFWLDGGTPQGPDDKTVPRWSNAVATCPGPDARDWAGASDHRLLGGWVSLQAREFGFMWDSAPIANRPAPFVRTSIFRTTDHAYLRTEDTFNADNPNPYCFMYPAAAVNSRGHVGVVVAGGSAVANVASSAFIVDDFVPTFSSQSPTLLFAGTDGAPTNRWGDFFTVVPHPCVGTTWIGTGQCMRGGNGFANQECDEVWFGRERDTPVWVNLNVQATLANVAITVDVMDRNGNQNGLTPFVRSYAPCQGYTLTAPLTVVDATNVTWDFVRWSVRFSPTGALNDQPIGQNVYVNTDIQYEDDTAIARYVRRPVVACNGCGPLTIAVAGQAALGGTLTTTLGNLTGDLRLIGIGFGPFCANPFCGTCIVGHGWESITLGTQRILAIPTDPAFLGAQLGIQGIDFKAAGGCPSPALALSDTIIATIG